MILYFVKINPNQISFLFYNSSSLNAFTAINESYNHTIDYLKTTDTYFNLLTVSNGKDLINLDQPCDRDVMTVNLEGQSLNSNSNMFNFHLALLHLNSQVIKTIPDDVTITLDVTFNNKLTNPQCLDSLKITGHKTLLILLKRDLKAGFAL